MSQFSRLMASAATGLDPINGSDNLMELQAAPSLLDLQRMQRIPPKVIQRENLDTLNYNTNSATIRHIAGGYNHEIFFRKNWKETMSQLKYHIDQQNSSILSDACSLWLHEWNESN